MLLVDTNVWIDHLRVGEPRLADALRAGEVLGHPWVSGELALGGAPSHVLELLGNLPQAAVPDASELAAFIAHGSLSGLGIGYVDAGLLASTRLSVGARLWTLDKRLQAAAEAHGVGG